MTLCMLILAGCATRSLRFADAEPVRYLNDIRPIPIPQSVIRDRFEYYATVQPPRPTIRPLKLPKSKTALDINAMDEVPASSWFIPRLGPFPISPSELAEGPFELGPPQPPVTIIRVRHPDQNPRLFVYDRRDVHYLLKFDPPDFPGIATASSFIANRLFWGFGYNVPEDHLFFLKRDDIKIDAASGFSPPEIDQILRRVAPPVSGEYRTIASRIIKGLPLGSAPEKGVRKEDANDLFPHQRRRVLRALKVFGALINMSNVGADNTLDLYVGPENRGYIKHYIIDFDDTFGTQAAREQRIWAGYNHEFDYKEILRNFFTLGFHVENWENIEDTLGNRWDRMKRRSSIHAIGKKFIPARFTSPAILKCESISLGL